MKKNLPVLKNKIALFFIYLFALFTFCWAIFQVGISSIAKVLQELKLYEISVLIALNTVVWLLSARRWGILLETQGHKISLGSLLLHRFSSFAVSYFTPGPQFGGEPLQVYLVKKCHQIPTSAIISSVVLDRIIDVFINLVVLAVFCILCWQIFPFIGHIFWTITTTIVVFGIVFLFYKKRKYFLGALLAKLFPQKIIDTIVQSEQHVKQILFSKACWYSILLSVLIWGFLIVEYWLSFYFLGLPLTFIEVVSVLLAMRVALLMPIPGGWGTIESSQVIALLAIGLNPAVGMGVTVLIRIRDLIASGIGFWWIYYVFSKRI